MKWLLALALANPSLHASQVWQDNFDSADSLKQWQLLEQKDDKDLFPIQTKSLTVKDGALWFEPAKSGWFNDAVAPFIFREVTGDFDVRAKLKVTGSTGTIPQSKWSLAGLMVRQNISAEQKAAGRHENWLFINTGIAEVPGQTVLESKYTLNSKSNLRLHPAQQGWIELRLVRAGFAFISLYRYQDKEPWQLLDRYYLQQMPATVQVGFNSYTASAGGPEDLKLQVDYIKLMPPKVKMLTGNHAQDWYQNVSSNKLTDFATSNTEVLKLIGN
jgi:hypothetical protein